MEEYIRSAHPVGSKTVVQRGIKSSPATVRNEMGDLETMGLLEQPHTSSGRLPTNRGLRYYVDHLLDKSRLGQEDQRKLDSLFSMERISARDLISETARFLSELSKQVGVIMIVPAERARLQAVYFREGGPDRIRVIFKFHGGTREERVIKNPEALDKRTLQKLTNLINKFAPGRTLVGLRRELIRQMEETRKKADLLLARAVKLSERLVDAGEPEVIIKGRANLFELPEFSEVKRTKELVRALEEKKLIVEMLEQVSLAAGAKVIIGEENMIGAMKDCSIITSTYGSKDMNMGTLGVIGPTRMDYARLIPVVRYTSELISECLSRYG